MIYVLILMTLPSGGILIETGTQFEHILKLLDDDSPEIQKIVRTTLLDNSLDIILDSKIQKFDLPEESQEQILSTLEEIHFEMVTRAMTQLCEAQLEDIDLEKAVLLLAYWNNPATNIPEMASQLDDMADEIRKQLPASGHPLSYIDIMNQIIFSDWGFEGNAEDYYNPENSFLDRILDTRKGIPISLSVLCMLLARRMGLPLVGIPMPAHFILKYDDGEDEIFFDPFYGGKVYSREECLRYLDQAKIENKDEILGGCTHYDIIARMMRNIQLVYSSYREEPEKSRQAEELLKLLEKYFQ